VGRTRTCGIAAGLLLMAVGGAAVGLSVADSPASQVSRQALVDHQRAVRLAGPRQPGGRADAVAVSAVPWHPTVPGQVATVSIPALDVVAPVVPEKPVDGGLAIPSDVHHVGWDSDSPAAGGQGVSLLVGHVNWVGQGEGALGQIGQLVPGDQVVVNWRGTQSVWTVSSPPRLSPNTVVHRSLFSDSGPATLVLVTCGGPFTETTHGGSYADNVIVTATPA
jgi:hypothetical protein